MNKTEREEFEFPPLDKCTKIWANAEKGKGDAVIDGLFEIDLCPSREKLLLIAAAEYKRCTALAAKLTALNSERGEIEEKLSILYRAAPATMKDAEEFRVARKDLTHKLADAVNRSEEARQATVHANAIRQRFTPFFGIDRLLPATDTLPPLVANELRRLEISENDPTPWAGVELRQIPRKPRERVAANMA